MSTEDEAFNQWWVDAWSGYETDITFTLGIEPVSANDDYVQLAMPFRPEIAQATGFLSCASRRLARSATSMS